MVWPRWRHLTVALQVVVEEGAPYGARNVQFGSQPCLIPLTPPACKQWCRVPQWAEVIAPGQTRLPGRDLLERVALQPPEEEANVADVVPALGLPDGTYVHGVTYGVERAFQAVDRFDTP